MARANLTVSAALREAFQSSCDGSKRWLSVVVRGEELVLTASGDAGATLATDFQSIVAHIAQNPATATSYIVRNDEDKWGTLLFIPEEADVRDKMLAAAGAADLKTSLSLSESVFQASSVEDVDYANFASNFNRSFAQPLSEAEVIAKQERQASKQAAAAVQGSAMNAVPFAVEPDINRAVEQLVAGASNFVEFVFDPEKRMIQSD